MSGPGNANVQSLDALRDLRLALLAFGERSRNAMGELRTKIDRTLAWLEEDRPLYWREQVLRAYDMVAGARVNYESCRMRTVGGRHSDCIDEKVAFQRAKARLEFCQHKVEVVRRRSIEAANEADEYRGRSGPLLRCVDDEVPNLVAMLTRMIDALEAYAEIPASSDESTAVSLGTVDSSGKSETTQSKVAVTPPSGAMGLPGSDRESATLNETTPRGD